MSTWYEAMIAQKLGFTVGEIVEVRNQGFGGWGRHRIERIEPGISLMCPLPVARLSGGGYIVLGGDGIRKFVGPLTEWEMRVYA